MPTKNEIAATMTRGEASRAGVATFTHAEEVAGVITANTRKLFGFTRKLTPQGLPTEPKIYIRSVSSYGEPIVDLGPGFKKYTIEPCPEGEPYGPACSVDPIIFFEEQKVDVTEHTFHSGQQIADAIMRIGPGMNAANDRRKKGWFMSPNAEPTEEEVKRALDLYTQECQKLLMQGNRYASANQLNEINEEPRRAATFLRQKVDWDKRVTKMMDCPGCGEAVKEGVIWHATPVGCGYIFDKKQYKEHFSGGQVPVQRAKEDTERPIAE